MPGADAPRAPHLQRPRGRRPRAPADLRPGAVHRRPRLGGARTPQLPDQEAPPQRGGDRPPGRRIGPDVRQHVPPPGHDAAPTKRRATAGSSAARTTAGRYDLDGTLRNITYPESFGEVDRSTAEPGRAADRGAARVHLGRRQPRRHHRRRQVARSRDRRHPGLLRHGRAGLLPGRRLRRAGQLEGHARRLPRRLPHQVRPSPLGRKVRPHQHLRRRGLRAALPVRLAPQEPGCLAGAGPIGRRADGRARDAQPFPGPERHPAPAPGQLSAAVLLPDLRQSSPSRGWRCG